MKPCIHFLLLLILSTFLVRCTSNTDRVKNLYSFAKVYGYVRWFYPGDEAAKIDWDKFAVYGAQKVEKARNEKELEQILNELFLPVAPALIINPSGTEKEWRDKLVPVDAVNVFPVSWLHYGVSLGEENYGYRSIRVNRDMPGMTCLKSPLIGIPMQQGKKINLSFSYKASVSGSPLSFVVSFTNNTDAYRYKVLERRELRLFSSSKWEQKELEATVPADAKGLYFEIQGAGTKDTIWFGDVSIALKENDVWSPLQFYNQDFSQGLAEWNIDIETKTIMMSEIDSTSEERPGRAVKIFPVKTPRLGDFFQAKIGKSLDIAMPLALYADNEKTFPLGDSPSFTDLQKQLEELPSSRLNTESRMVKMANVIILWNVMQHFYPYFDVVQVNWEQKLIEALTAVYSSKTEVSYYKILNQMVVALSDGHGFVFTDKLKKWYFPATVEYVENKVVVVDPYTGDLKKGDIIKEIDGKTFHEEIEYQEKLFSGSPQFKRALGLQLFGSAFKPGSINIVVERGGESFRLKVQRLNKVTAKKKNKKYDLLNGNYYIERDYTLTHSDLDILAKARGIIIDGSPRWRLLPHIITKPVLGPQIYIPITTFPDRKKVAYKILRTVCPPEEPFIKAKLVFITHSDEASAQETFLQIVEHYNLGTLIGEDTGGTNGGLNILPLIGGYQIRWTGEKVLNHDGSQLHLNGIKPKYYVNRSLNNILTDGTDEYLERAKEVLKEEIMNK